MHTHLNTRTHARAHIDIDIHLTHRVHRARTTAVCVTRDCTCDYCYTMTAVGLVSCSDVSCVTLCDWRQSPECITEHEWECVALCSPAKLFPNPASPPRSSP